MKIGNLDGISDLRGQLPGREDYPTRELADLAPDGALKWIVIHHTAGAERDFSALEIARYHVDTLGWPGPIVQRRFWLMPLPRCLAQSIMKGRLSRESFS